MSARLRVGVLRGQGALGRGTGHGRAWDLLLAHLHPHADVIEVARPGRARAGAVDVWCFDGHVAPPAVTAPSVVLVHDVRWTDPTIAADLSVSFVAVIVPETEVAVRTATRVAVPSSFARDGVLDAYGANPARVDLVPYGVDTAVFRPGLPGGAELVAAALGHRAAPLPRYVLFVGTVEPRKHLDVLRGAMASLASTHDHVLALRVGPAPGADSRTLLAAAAADLPGAPGRIAALPPLPEDQLAALMAGADALCLPSTAEGFGFPVVEAMAAGTPVVVAERGSLPELVGDAGVLVEPTVTDVARGLASVLDDEARATRLAARGLDRARRFTWDASARALLASLERAADERGRAAPPAPRALRADVSVVEIAACPACGAPRQGSAMVGTDRVPLRRCARCHTVFSSRAFAPGSLAPDDDARAHDAEWFGIPVAAEVLEDQRMRAAHGRLALLATPPGRQKLRIPPEGRLLDVQVGAGTGARVAAALGWDVTTTRALTDALALGDEFDAVVVAHALAREPDALGALCALRARTRPGGWLLVETPNWASPTRTRGVDAWHGARPLEHVVQFTPATLQATVARAGWEPVWTGTRTWLGGDLVRDTHTLVPFRRVLRAGAARTDDTATAVTGLRRAYDAAGLGDVVVAVARRPVSDRGDARGRPPLGRDGGGS